MKIVVLCLFCFLPGILIAATCADGVITDTTVYTCSTTVASSLGACETKLYTNEADDTNGYSITYYDCPVGEFCLETNQNDALTGSQYEYHCVTKYADGVTCTSAEECQCNSCMNSKCTEEARRSEGDSCDETLQCRAGLFCTAGNSRTCFSQAGEDEYCDTTIEGYCQVGYICHPIDKTCHKIMSVENDVTLFSGEEDDLTETKLTSTALSALKYICKSLTVVEIKTAVAPYTYTVQCVDPPALTGASTDTGLKTCTTATEYIDCAYTWLGEDVTYSATEITALTSKLFVGYSMLATKFGCSGCNYNGIRKIPEASREEYCYPGGGEEFLATKKEEYQNYFLSSPDCVTYSYDPYYCNEFKGNEGNYYYTEMLPSERILNEFQTCQKLERIEGLSGASHLVISILGLLLSIILII